MQITLKFADSLDRQVLTDPQAKELNKLIPSLAEAGEILSMTPIWPLAVHAFAAVFCMGCSATYHLMYVRNIATAKILIRLDYGGITVLIFGTCVPVIIYCFTCSQTHGKLILSADLV